MKLHIPKLDEVFKPIEKEQKYKHLSLSVLNKILEDHKISPIGAEDLKIDFESIHLPIYEECIAKIKKHIFRTGKKVLNYFTLIISMAYERYTLKTYESLIPNVNRKLIKNGVMTLFYGSSNSTRRKNYVNNFIDQTIEKGIILTKEDEINFQEFAKYIDKSLIQWINKKLPQALILKQLFTKFNNDIRGTKDQLFNPSLIENQHCIWYYKPPLVTECIKSINGRNYRLQKYINLLNRKKLKTSFLANYIQFCDASIAAMVTEQMKKKGIPLLTVHDCFKCPYEYATELNDAILNAYINFYNNNSMEKQFSQNNPELIKEFELMKKRAKIQSFLSSEIHAINLFKY